MIKLMMCDLDNTLLPLHTQDKFVEIWFRDVAKKFHEHGLNAAHALNAMNEGCRAMVFNKSNQLNIDLFYEVACGLSGYPREVLEPVLNDYYATTFDNVRKIARENPYAPMIARLMREKAQYAVIATMPMFPIEACDKRLSWVGLSAKMFDLVTTCDYSTACKPNPKYFQEILEDFNVKPSEALMIGNDVREDMEPCELLGINTFLVTDNIITHGLPYSRFRQGDYPALIDYLNSL
jgi:FMN phosphatase YigB (HAD superfamily)